MWYMVSTLIVFTNFFFKSNKFTNVFHRIENEDYNSLSEEHQIQKPVEVLI
jgi:hypothetical protein